MCVYIYIYRERETYIYTCNMYIHTHVKHSIHMCLSISIFMNLFTYLPTSGVGTLRHLFAPAASAQWQPDGLTIRTKRRFLGAGFLGAPPMIIIIIIIRVMIMLMIIMIIGAPPISRIRSCFVTVFLTSVPISPEGAVGLARRLRGRQTDNKNTD